MWQSYDYSTSVDAQLIRQAPQRAFYTSLKLNSSLSLLRKRPCSCVGRPVDETRWQTKPLLTHFLHSAICLWSAISSKLPKMRPWTPEEIIQLFGHDQPRIYRSEIPQSQRGCDQTKFKVAESRSKIAVWCDWALKHDIIIILHAAEHASLAF